MYKLLIVKLLAVTFLCEAEKNTQFNEARMDGEYLITARTVNQLRNLFGKNIGGLGTKYLNSIKNTASQRSLDGLGQGNILNGRSLDRLGHGNILNGRSLDRLGQGNILNGRSLDGLGRGNILNGRSLDRLGQGNILNGRSLDRLGQGNILNGK